MENQKGSCFLKKVRNSILFRKGQNASFLSTGTKINFSSSENTSRSFHLLMGDALVYPIIELWCHFSSKGYMLSFRNFRRGMGMISFFSWEKWEISLLFFQPTGRCSVLLCSIFLNKRENGFSRLKKGLVYLKKNQNSCFDANISSKRLKAKRCFSSWRRRKWKRMMEYVFFSLQRISIFFSRKVT